MDRGRHDTEIDFEVRTVAVEVDEYGNLNVGLADNEEGDGLSLIFSAPSEENDPEVDLRDTYSISTETGATAYGGILAVRIEGDLLTIDLTPEAAGELGTDEHLRLRLRLDVASLDTLRGGLRKALEAGNPPPREIAR